MDYKGKVYLDELSFSSVLFILKFPKKYQLYLLEDIKSLKEIFLFWFLSKLNYKLSTEDFFAGHLKTPGGDIVTIAAVREASSKSVELIRDCSYSSLLSKFLPADYDAEVINVFLSKSIYRDLYYVFLRSMIVESLSGNDSAMLIIKKPKKINPLDFKEKTNLDNLRFYKVYDFFVYKACKSYLYYFITQTIKKVGYYFLNKENSIINTDLPALMSIQSNTLRKDLSLRGEPNWIDRDNTSPTHNTIILSKTYSYFNKGHKMHIASDFNTLAENNVFSVPINSVARIPSLKFLFKFFIRGYKYRKHITEELRYYLLELLYIYNESINFEKFIKKYNIKLVYFAESSISESICMISRKLEIKTLAQQYSNLPFFSVIMTGKVDNFLVASSMYEKCFKLP
mgnify:CR=1 FL=1